MTTKEAAALRRKLAKIKDWECQDCGKAMTVKQAERASRVGCSCGSTDIDIIP